jgi:hypothetical protein
MFILFIVYLANDRQSLVQQVDDLSTQVAAAGERIAEQDKAAACARKLASEESLARFHNEIRFNRYVLAIGGLGVVTEAQHAVLASTTEMEAAEQKRLAYDADPVGFCATYL